MTSKTKTLESAAKPRTTKKSQLIRMLSARAGADVATISGKLDWQTHTTRAAITGLRKAGYEITVEKAEGGKPTRYRIIAEPPPAEGDAQSAAVPEETVDAG
jgi:hypothetical protein